MGNIRKCDPPNAFACYLCGGAQKIPKALAAAYQLLADNKGSHLASAECRILRSQFGEPSLLFAIIGFDEVQAEITGKAK